MEKPGRTSLTVRVTVSRQGVSKRNGWPRNGVRCASVLIRMGARVHICVRVCVYTRVDDEEETMLVK